MDRCCLELRELDNRRDDLMLNMFACILQLSGKSVDIMRDKSSALVSTLLKVFFTPLSWCCLHHVALPNGAT